ncbi:hypothetical protein GCM10020255_069910 [Rhodococcus baikonurensis]
MRPHLKTLALTAAAAALTVSLTACGSSDNAAKEVTVVGSGQVRGAPDILNADIGIEVVAPDVSGAVSESNDKARQMIDAIVAAGVAPRTYRQAICPSSRSTTRVVDRSSAAT